MRFPIFSIFILAVLLYGCTTVKEKAQNSAIPQTVLDQFDQLNTSHKAPFLFTCTGEDNIIYEIDGGAGDFYTLYFYDNNGNLLELYPYSPFYKSEGSKPRTNISNYNCTFVKAWKEENIITKNETNNRSNGQINNTIINKTETKNDLPCLNQYLKCYDSENQWIYKLNYSDLRSGPESYYNETVTLNESGLLINFEPAIGTYPTRIDKVDYYAIDNRFLFHLPSGNWVITQMKADKSSSFYNHLSIAKEFDYGIINREDYIQSGTMNIRLVDEYWDDLDRALFGIFEFEDTKTGFKRIVSATDGQTINVNGRNMHLWIITPEYIFNYWAAFSVVDDEIDLTLDNRLNYIPLKQYNVTIQWTNNTNETTYAQSALKSIFIPRSSPIFEELILSPEN